MPVAYNIAVRHHLTLQDSFYTMRPPTIALLVCTVSCLLASGLPVPRAVSTPGHSAPQPRLVSSFGEPLWSTEFKRYTGQENIKASLPSD